MSQGPKAPKDPTKNRSGFYIMLDAEIEAAYQTEGKPSQAFYLDDGRLVNKAQLEGCITDEGILDLLKDASGFHKLVHSIGITIAGKTTTVGQEIQFILHFYGKKDKYGSGTLYRVPILANGAEVIVDMADIDWSDDDDVPGQIKFECNEPGEQAIVSIKLYLQDGYSAPEVELDPKVPFGSEDYQKMIAKSFMSMGNNYRLKNAIQKAREGKDINIAYIGGSITQGAGAKPIHSACYAYQSFCQFKEIIAGKDAENIHYVKAGVGGTPSELGMLRYDRDVLKDGSVIPDIVVVEFAVNDEGDETKGQCYESLVTKILSQPNVPAVILLFSVFSNDWNLQERLAPIGTHYDLPMVSVLDAVTGQFGLSVDEGRIISKRQFFYDCYHPTNAGHTIMADCLAYLLQKVTELDGNKEDICINQEPLLSNDFKEVHLLDGKDNLDKAKIECGGFCEKDESLQFAEMDLNLIGTPQFPYNWMHTPSSGHESFKMKIKCESLLFIFKDSASEETGNADVFVDGKHILQANPHICGWTHCNPVILFRKGDAVSGKAVSEHEIEICMSNGDEDKYFTILGFGFVE